MLSRAPRAPQRRTSSLSRRQLNALVRGPLRFVGAARFFWQGSRAWIIQMADCDPHSFVPINAGLFCGVPKRRNPSHLVEESVLEALIGALRQ